MVNYSKIFNKIWSLFRRQGNGLQGVRQSIMYPNSQSTNLKLHYDIPETPIRPVYGDLNNSYDLLEMYHWCLWVRHSIDTVAADCFQEVGGQVTSWYVNDTLNDGSKVAPEVLEIAKELSYSRNGKDLILGGDALMRAAIECLAFGDSFLELGLDKSGINSSDWDIVSSQFLPPFSIFAERDAQSQTVKYIQRTKLTPSETDIELNPVKILHFRYKPRGLYGNPITFPALEPWRKFKEASISLETAAKDVGIVPWLHILPKDKTEQDRIDYMERHESMSASGIITNMYLFNDSDIRKAVSGSGDSLESLTNYSVQLANQCIPPRVPVWLFPGLTDASGNTRDILGQPALTYSRLIAEVRSLLGEQIRWAICLKIVLRYGYDFYIENRNFDVKWPEWVLTPLSDYVRNMNESTNNANNPQDNSQNNSQDNLQPENKKDEQIQPEN